MADKVYKVLISILGEDKASPQVKSVGDSLDGLTKNVAIASASIVAAMAVAKEGFEFAEEGANIMRLEEAGDNLATSMGSNMDDIVAAIRRASNGTVTNTNIILAANRAMMLGLSSDADKLANLMEVAGFRGRAMGISTTQAFSDIVTGIGRMSPMILDNLGIVIDAEKRFADYAETMGISTVQIDSATKKQILLDGVLEEGNKMLDEAGGLAVDTATSYEQFRASATNVTDALKKQAAEGLLPIIQGWEDLLSLNQDAQAGMQEHSKQYIASGMAYDQYIAAMTHGMVITKQMTETDKNNIAVMVERKRAMGEMIDAPILERYGLLSEAEYELAVQAESAKQAQEEQVEVGIEWGNALEMMYAKQNMFSESTAKTAEETAAFEAEMLAVNRQSRAMIENLDTLTPKLDSFFTSIDRDLGSPISSFIKDLTWMMAGGGGYTAQLQAIQKALVSGTITPEQAKALASDLMVAMQQGLVDAGLQDTEGASQAISDALGVPVEEAAGKLDDFASGLDALEANRRELQIDIETNDRYNTLMVLEELMSGKTFYVNFTGSYSGGGGSGGGGGGYEASGYSSNQQSNPGKGEKPIAQAAGGAWLVSEPTTFMAGEGSEDEYAFFVPKSKMGRGGDGEGESEGPAVVNQYFRDAAAAALGMAWVEQMRRERLGW